MAVLVEVFGLKSYLLKNFANVLAIELSTIYNFCISRLWTWEDAPKKSGKGLVAQFFSFNLAALTGIGLRVIILFPVLEKLGVFYLLNVAIGIGAAASLDFILFDKLVFRREGYQRRAPKGAPNPLDQHVFKNHSCPN